MFVHTVPRYIFQEFKFTDHAWLRLTVTYGSNCIHNMYVLSFLFVGPFNQLFETRITKTSQFVLSIKLKTKRGNTLVVPCKTSPSVIITSSLHEHIQLIFIHFNNFNNSNNCQNDWANILHSIISNSFDRSYWFDCWLSSDCNYGVYVSFGMKTTERKLHTVRWEFQAQTYRWIECVYCTVIPLNYRILNAKALRVPWFFSKYNKNFMKYNESSVTFSLSGARHKFWTYLHSNYGSLVVILNCNRHILFTGVFVPKTQTLRYTYMYGGLVTINVLPV